MKNKITKFLTILSIIFISFFVNQNKVLAEICSWYTYQTYIDSSGNAINSNLDNKGTSIRTNMDDKYHIYINTADSTFFFADYFIEGREKDGKNYLNPENFTKFKDNEFKGFLDNNGYNCPKYIKLYKEGNDFIITSATVNDYKNYLNTQYDGLTYDPSTIGGLALNAKNLYTSLDKKTMFFRKLSYSGTYYNDSKSHKELENLKDSNGNSANFDFNKFGLSSQSLDISEPLVEYYSITKERWFNVLNADSQTLEQCGDYFGTCGTAKIRLHSKSFYNWFIKVDDLILEDSYETYIKAYKFANLYTYKTEKEFNDAVSVFDQLLNVKKDDSKLESLTDSSCEVYCVNYNNSDENNKNNSTIAYEECKKSQKYTNCKTAYNACKGIASSSDQERCIKNKLGEEEYNNLKSLNENKKNEIIDDRDNSINEIRDILKRVTTPSLDVDFEPYEVTCDDVAIFHTFYVILQIAAPILVILFGSIDYARAVMASDVEKMQKAKKNFPKRLGALILFIFVPLIINFIINAFAPSTSTHLMYCIVNGG